MIVILIIGWLLMVIGSLTGLTELWKLGVVLVLLSFTLRFGVLEKKL